MKYTYLLIDFFTLLFPLILSFHARSSFYKTWKGFFPAVTISGIFFIVWDMYFTKLGMWGFNAQYILGIYLGNLPIEEILFFFCIPYACVFTFWCFKNRSKKSVSKKGAYIITALLTLLFLIIAFIYKDRKYTFSTFVVLALLHALAVYILKINWLLKFYLVYCVLLIPFMIVNGLLTGTGLAAPVVWYNSSGIIGPRLLTIPVEDIFYGMDLIMLNLLIFMPLSSKVNAEPQVS